MIDRKPIKVTVGATTTRRVLKMSVSNVLSFEPAPLIKRKPRMTIAIPTANNMKLTLSNAKFLLSIIISLLNLIQVSRLHLQELVDGDAGAERGDDDAEEEYGSTRDGKFLPSQDSQEFWLVIIPSIDTSSEESISHKRRQQTDKDSTTNKRTTDKTPRGAHQLHRMDGEATCIDTQSHRIVDQGERDERQQDSHHQQADAYLSQRLVDLFYQVVLIRHLGHPRVSLEFLGYPLERVIVGIISHGRNLNGRLERIDTSKLARVGAEITGRLLQSLLLGNIGQAIDVRACLQFLAHLQALRIGHVLLKHHRHHEVLLDIGRQVPSHQNGKNDESQQNEYHGGTYT